MAVDTAPPRTSSIGSPVTAREDPRLLTGNGHYIDDFSFPGMAHAAIVRSSHAHARIRNVDVTPAEQIEGVIAAYWSQDLPELHTPIPPKVTRPELRDTPRYAIARHRVRYVGEPVAVVVAASRYLAEDAAEQVVVDYEPLPAAASVEQALSPAAEQIHEDAPGNVVASIEQRIGDVDLALASSPHRLREVFHVHRGGGHSMECRGMVAQYDPMSQRLTLWDATQVPHYIRSGIARLLRWDDDQIRVVAPDDVGGGFGPKAAFYGEELILAVVAHRLRRTIKWIEDRHEHLTSAQMEREQIHEVEIGFDDDGRILALSDRFAHDQGAYCIGLQTPLITASTIPGPYVIPAFRSHMRAVLTNLTPSGSVRGAGRPQAVFAMERMLDRVARHLGLEPHEVRRRNLIPADAFPYEVGLMSRDGSPVRYDSGDYPQLLDRATGMLDIRAFRAEQAEARGEGRHLGLGIAMYVESTGLGPFESANARVTVRGSIAVRLGAPPQGQGFQTVFAQIAADALGTDISAVHVSTGDTDEVAISHGTFASRVTVTGGSAVWLACRQLRDRILEAASVLLQVPPDALALDNGAVVSTEQPSKRIELAELARWCNTGVPGVTFPADLEPGLSADATFVPRGSAYSSGIHVCTVEVDPVLGTVRFLRYIVGHDCGTMINPLFVEGQTIGGLAHGIGNALLERMHYDDAGQPLTASYLDYALPAASIVPRAELFHVVSPSPLNPLGAKGAGEGGTIPAPAAVANAIEDALAGLGVRVDRAPVHPSYLSDLVAAARQGNEG